MSLKFAANLNFLFTENAPTIVERIKLAHKAGFKAVEIPYPSNETNEVIKTKSDLNMEIALVNIALDEHKMGTTAIPGAEEGFRNRLKETIDFAKEVSCKKIHLMSGTMSDSGAHQAYLQTYKTNLKYAIDELTKENLMGVIEPINKYAVPGYFMNCYDVGTRQSKPEINVRLVSSATHSWKYIQSFAEFGSLIGHIQIAQVPHRHEPHVQGELDYAHVFSVIKNSGYQGWIGCEYKPKTNTLEGLKWLEKYGLQL